MTQGLVSALLRYTLTGLLVAGLDVSVYTLLSSGIGMWYMYAHTLSRAVGGATGFVLNRRWTFGRKGREELVTHGVKFAITYLFSYVASSWLLYLWVETFRVSAVRGKLIAEGTMFLFNFLILRQWAFRRRLRPGQLRPVGLPSPLTPVGEGWRSGDR